MTFFVFCPLSSVLCLLLTGCGPEYTYPAGKVPEAVEKICRGEYQMTVNARVVGKTVGALFYTKQILDASGQVPKEVHEEMGKVMMAVTRVALSTDLPVDFCVVVIRDKKHPVELVITRSLDDTKRANADMIGIEESINRTLFGQAKFHPRADGTGPFVLKEVKLEKFLTDQIVQRIRFGLAKDLKDAKNSKAAEEKSRPMVLVDGAFEDSAGTPATGTSAGRPATEAPSGKRVFRFSVLSLKQDNPRETTLSVFKIVNQVFEGYHYENFDLIEIRDYLNRQKLAVDKNVLLAYQQKKITDQQLLERYLVESKVAQEAFKLFGFNVPFSPDGEDAVLPAAPEE